MSKQQYTEGVDVSWVLGFHTVCVFPSSRKIEVKRYLKHETRTVQQGAVANARSTTNLHSRPTTTFERTCCCSVYLRYLQQAIINNEEYVIVLAHNPSGRLLQLLIFYFIAIHFLFIFSSKNFFLLLYKINYHDFLRCFFVCPLSKVYHRNWSPLPHPLYINNDNSLRSRFKKCTMGQ